MVEIAKKYLEILGLKPGADSEEIKQTFKALAFQYHPDRNPHNLQAEEQFKKIVEAYSYLSGNQEAYSALRNSQESSQTQAHSDLSEDIYQSLFDLDLSPQASKKKDLELKLPLSLEEAFQGGRKEIVYQQASLCRSCLGSGTEANAKVFTCTYCFGEGEIEVSEEKQKECPKCNGRGFLSAQGCLDCRARGVFYKKHREVISLPKHYNPSQSYGLPSQGHEYELSKRSDVKIHFQLQKHPRFIFDGGDVICDLCVHMSEAALGARVFVETLAGLRPLQLSVGTQSGQVFCLKGLGLGGDQLVRISVKTPSPRSEKEKNLLEGLSSEDQRKEGWWSRIKKWIW